MANGQVLVNEQPLRNKLFRHIEKKIQKWVERREGRQKDEFNFLVAFTEDDAAKRVECVTEIQLGENRYRGCEFAADTQSAFMHSLKRLQPH